MVFIYFGNMKQALIIPFLLFCTWCNYLNAQTVHELARTGTVEQMKAYLVKDSLALNRLSERGISPFILACYRGNNDVAKFLLDCGADVTYCTPEGSDHAQLPTRQGIFSKRHLSVCPIWNAPSYGDVFETI
jgi:hypothetical protein